MIRLVAITFVAVAVVMASAHPSLAEKMAPGSHVLPEPSRRGLEPLPPLRDTGRVRRLTGRRMACSWTDVARLGGDRGVPEQGGPQSPLPALIPFVG